MPAIIIAAVAATQEIAGCKNIETIFQVIVCAFDER
jgi:hypothetical protein